MSKTSAAAAKASTSDHFALFGLTPAFSLDLARLEAAYREVQSKVHPDRFTQAGDAERRVVDHLLRGLSESAIARTLDIARPTLHNHVTNIYRKFGVGSRAELMALWLGRTGDAGNLPASPG